MSLAFLRLGFQYLSMSAPRPRLSFFAYLRYQARYGYECVVLPLSLLAIVLTAAGMWWLLSPDTFPLPWR